MCEAFGQKCCQTLLLAAFRKGFEILGIVISLKTVGSINLKSCQHVQERLGKVLVVSLVANVALTSSNLTTVQCVLALF